MKKVLRIVYNRYKRIFYELFVEEFIGEMPKEVSEPAMNFLMGSREKMEKWIFYQAYWVQRRGVSEGINRRKDEIYMGMMVYLKMLLVICSLAKPKSKKEEQELSESVKEITKVVNIDEEITNFKHGVQNYRKNIGNKAD